MAKQTAKSPAKRPVHEVRMGRIKATIWENETREGIRHNVSLSRIYKDGEAWKDSTSFGRDDLPLVAKVADLAHTGSTRTRTQRRLSNRARKPSSNKTGTR